MNLDKMAELREAMLINNVKDFHRFIGYPKIWRTSIQVFAGSFLSL